MTTAPHRGPHGAALVALALLAGCTGAADRQVLLVVHSDYERSGPLGVDRYALTVYRRGHDGRWRHGPDDVHVYFFGWSPVQLTGAAVDAGSAPYHLPADDDDGRHLLVPQGASDADDVLVEVQPGASRSDAVFVPTGLPAVAQFRFPSGRGRIELGLEPACRGVDPVASVAAQAGSGALAPWFACTAGATGGCPAFASICFSFDAAGATRLPRCPEQPDAPSIASDGGAAPGTPCPLAPGESTDGGGIGASVAPGATLAWDGCAAGGAITCGLDGRWSRCVAADPPCGPGGDEGDACCPTLDPALGCADASPSRACRAGLACDRAAGACVPCGRVHGPCCPDAPACLPSEGACVDGFCACGDEGRPCCPDGPAPCSAGLTCSLDGACVRCGTVGAPCCDGNVCGAGLACDAAMGLCTVCGSTSQPCCPTFAGVDHECTSGLVCRSGVCRQCGHPGTPCCPDAPHGASGPLCDNRSICVSSGRSSDCVACGAAADQPCCNGTCTFPLHCSITTNRCAP